MARILGGSDKVSFSSVSRFARRWRKRWYVIDPETWCELEVPQRHRWLWWRRQRVIAVECPQGHRRELRGKAVLKLLRAILQAAAADLPLEAIPIGYGGEIRCPSCGRSYRYEMHIASWGSPE